LRKATKRRFSPFIRKIFCEFAIMNQCDMIIGNDDGAINMAKALETSVYYFSPWIDKKVGLHLKTN
jgi:heptosyltransferase-2